MRRTEDMGSIIQMMDEKNIPYFFHEGDMARMERTNKRLFIICLVLIFVLLGSNGAWIFYESRFEDITVEQEVETGEGSATITGVGDIRYGESEADRESPQEENP